MSKKTKAIRAWASIDKKSGRIARQPGHYPFRYIIFEMEDHYEDNESIEVEIRPAKPRRGRKK